MLEMNSLTYSAIIALAVLVVIYIIRLNRRPVKIMTEPEKESYARKKSKKTTHKKSRKKKPGKIRKICSLLILLFTFCPIIWPHFPGVWYIASIAPILAFMFRFYKTKLWKDWPVAWPITIYVFFWAIYLINYLKGWG